MSKSSSKATGKKASRLPVPPPPAALQKTNLALTVATLTALNSLKALGYSKTFAIERGVLMFAAKLNGGAK